MRSQLPDRLPIEDHLATICQGLREHAALVLEAPPGAGKTTMVPLALLHEPWCTKLIVTEPRRMAAKAAARRMASLLGERVGETVGYRVRNDTCVSPRTRIEVVTEGVLVNMITSQPTLPGISCVLFDEFHERTLQADTGLGLTILSQELLRDDLKVVVMSATLASLPLERILPGARRVISAGTQYPVDTTWLRSADDRPLPVLVAAAVSDALRSTEGDVLVFLPGRAEIRACERVLHERKVITDGLELHVLHGDVDTSAQDAILSARRPGASRRVILSTSSAETSVTIDGLRTVIDAGLAREPRFDPRAAMTHLVTVPVSVDAAEQRRGRAGRQAPGQCIRLWTREQEASLPERRTPEIRSSDLSSLLVQVAAYGVEVNDLPLIDAPPAAAVAQARQLLTDLDALDTLGERDDLDVTFRLTPHGRAIAQRGTHPRLAHMEIIAEQLGLGSIAGRVREALESGADLHFTGVDPLDVGRCVALAYPDRIAARKDGTRYLLRNGRTVRLDDQSSLAQHPWLAVADVGGGLESKQHAQHTLPWISRAAPLSLDIIRQMWADHLTEDLRVGWDERTEQVVAVTCERLGALTLQQRPATNVPPEELALAFAQALVERDYRDLPWTTSTVHLRHRLNVLKPWPEILTPESLAPYLIGMKTLRDVRRLSLERWIQSCVSGQDRRLLEQLAPATYTTPSGRSVTIDYSNPDRPMISVRLQWMLGVGETPRIANGTIPLTIELLSPAQRPIQVTQDLAGFWHGSYQQVRKEMRGRYPKHDWPEDPS